MHAMPICFPYISYDTYAMHIEYHCNVSIIIAQCSVVPMKKGRSL